MSWKEFNTLYFERWKSAAQKELAEYATRLVNFCAFPYGPMVDEEVHKLTRQQHDEWAEIVGHGMHITFARLRDVFQELKNGPVDLIHSEIDLNNLPLDNMSWSPTVREYYDYMKKKLKSFVD